MNRPCDRPNRYGQRGIELDSDRDSTRGGSRPGPRSGPGMTSRRMPEYDAGRDDLVDDFDDMGMDPRKHPTPGGPQGRRGPRHSDNIDGFDEDNIDPPGPSARGAPRGKAGTRSGHMDNPVTGVAPYVPKGSRAGGSRGARPRTDDDLPVSRDSRRPRPQTAHPRWSLHELELKLDQFEDSKRRAEQALETARTSDVDLWCEKFNKAAWAVMDIKNEIYKINPQSERLDSMARFFLNRHHNPDRDHGDHEPRHSRQGPAPWRRSWPWWSSSSRCA